MKMRIFLVASTVFLVSGSPFGPPPTENEVLPSKTNTDCSSIDGCGNESSVQLSASKLSSAGDRFSQEANDKATRRRPYWWEGQNNPFKGGCSPGAAGCPSYPPGKVLLPSSSTNNKVVNSFGAAGGLQISTSGGSQCVCPSSFACVHWQFCQDGVMIVDGSVSTDQSKTSIPEQISSTFESCGRNMICCRIPTCEDAGQAPSFQTSNKFSPPKQIQNVPSSHFSKIKPHSEVDSQSTVGFGVLQAQQDSNKLSQTQVHLPVFESQEKQKETHFSAIPTESKKTFSSPHDSIKSNQFVQPGTFHSSQKIPGVKEISSEFAVFTKTASPEKVVPELDTDDISGYLPPSPTFQAGQSQLQEKTENNKFNKPSLPEQGTKFTSPSVVSHSKPDQTAQISGTEYQTKQQLKPIDKDEEKRPSYFSGKPDQNKIYEEDSTGSFDTKTPITPQSTIPVKTAPGDSNVFTTHSDSGSSGQFTIKFPASPNEPSHAESHKFDGTQGQGSTFISGQVGSTKETKFQGSQYKPEVSALQLDQAFNSGSFGAGNVEQVHSTFTSGQAEKAKQPKFPTSQYQPDQQTHIGAVDFQSAQHTQSNLGKPGQQAKPDHTLSITSSAANKLADNKTSFQTQSQQHQFTEESSGSSFVSGAHGNQYQSGHSQGRPDSTFSSGLFGPSQQHIDGGFGSSSFASGQPGSQFQFDQSNVNVGAGFQQPGQPESTNSVIRPQGSGVNLHGTASSSIERGSPSTGVISGTSTQSSGMGGMMMMMMGPMLVGGKMMLNGEVMKTVSGNPLISGSCSAGQFCLPRSDCNPYNGFIILYANQQFAASFPNAPTVPLMGCHVGGISDSESFCCQLPHPLLGPDGKPFD